jgi:hypothetical protein
MIKSTYFRVTTTISARSISESTPRATLTDPSIRVQNPARAGACASAGAEEAWEAYA